MCRASRAVPAQPCACVGPFSETTHACPFWPSLSGRIFSNPVGSETCLTGMMRRSAADTITIACQSQRGDKRKIREPTVPTLGLTDDRFTSKLSALIGTSSGKTTRLSSFVLKAMEGSRSLAPKIPKARILETKKFKKKNQSVTKYTTIHKRIVIVQSSATVTHLSSYSRPLQKTNDILVKYSRAATRSSATLGRSHNKLLNTDSASLNVVRSPIHCSINHH